LKSAHRIFQNSTERRRTFKATGTVAKTATTPTPTSTPTHHVAYGIATGNFYSDDALRALAGINDLDEYAMVSGSAALPDIFPGWISAEDG